MVTCLKFYNRTWTQVLNTESMENIKYIIKKAYNIKYIKFGWKLNLILYTCTGWVDTNCNVVCEWNVIVGKENLILFLLFGTTWLCIRPTWLVSHSKVIQCDGLRVHNSKQCASFNTIFEIFVHKSKFDCILSVY